MRRPRITLALLAAVVSSTAYAQTPFTYDEGTPIPRFLTPDEQVFLRRNPGYFDGTRAVTSPPTGPVRCVAEYEPMDGIIIAWEGTSSWKSILANMGAQITTVGNAELYVTVDNSGEISSATSTLTSAGTDMLRVQFVTDVTDTIWCRDYGPRYIYEGNCRAIVDHTYNRPRPNDDKFPTAFGLYKNHGFYEHGLIHGGGNYHLNALGSSYATDLVSGENPSLTDAQIISTWQSYQNVNTDIVTAIPATIDSTQHLDMWMQIIDDGVVVISDWPTAVGSTQDVTCDAQAAAMAAAGWTVHRVPALSVFGTHYTYTNVVMCNNLVLIPSYTNGTVTPYNAQALANWQAAAPTKTVVQINSQAIVTSAGVLHCIVMHVPSHLGGVNPTAYLRSPNGGESLTSGNQVQIDWISDDDVAVTSVDLLLSTDSGASFPTTVASGLAPTGSYSWTVPALCVTNARLRVVVNDGSGNTGSDDSDADFAITGCGGTCVYTTYGAGLGGANIGTLASSSATQIGIAQTISASGFNGPATGMLVLSKSMASSPFKGGTALIDMSQQIRSFSLGIDGAGNGSFGFTLPNNPGLVGRSYFVQAFVPDATQSQGWALSDGLSVVICQ